MLFRPLFFSVFATGLLQVVLAAPLVDNVGLDTRAPSGGPLYNAELDLSKRVNRGGVAYAQRAEIDELNKRTEDISKRDNAGGVGYAEWAEIDDLNERADAIDFSRRDNHGGAAYDEDDALFERDQV